MTQLLARPRNFAGWVRGLIQKGDHAVVPLGTIEAGENFVAVAGGGLRTRGGSRIVLTLLDGSSNEVAHTPLLVPFTPCGMIAIGWSDALNKHYAYRLTANGAVFDTDMPTSRHDLTGMAAGAWNNGTVPARPVAAELWEKLFVCDANITYASRNTFFSINSAGALVEPTFAFGAGAAQAIRPYCLEEYNGVLFIAGYGTEDASDADRPEMLRHSFLGKSPDAADGFDPFAFALIGAKGQRITGLRKGRGILLVAKENELFRVTGFGRAYAGWQYTIEPVMNTAGLGVSNPLALAFAEVNGAGYWYGIGKSGPWRSDGFGVETLVEPRDWRDINLETTSWVSFHPDRRVVLFGVHPAVAVSGRSTTHPWKIWAWDVDRDVWTADWVVTGSDPAYATACPSGTIATPSGPPTGPSTTSITATGFTANWTCADASAETEYWEKTGTAGTWALASVKTATTATHVVTGKVGHQDYYWKVRHRIGSVYTDYAAEQTVQTLIPVPIILTITSTKTGVPNIPVDLLVEVDAAGSSVLDVEGSADGVAGWVLISSTTVQAGNVHIFGGHCAYWFRAISRDALWTPTMSSYSSPFLSSCAGSP